ncbi:MAG: two-component sensor histidine kinase [Chitinophagaceae bacterium]|nr:two-component sensor histidine kinase [Chitinophagaceae bacterium]
MEASTKKKLARATLVYWFLLLYIIGALIWWLVLLQQQNKANAALKIDQLRTRVDSVANTSVYMQERKEILTAEDRNTTKFLGEGITFLALIIVGAGFVYRAVREQLRTQQQQQNFMMAITHELKTPIAIAKLNLETLQKHQLDEVKRQKIIDMTLQETNRLNTLTNNILVSSQLEGERYATSREELNFSDLVKSCVNDYKNRFPTRDWSPDIEEEIETTGDPLLLAILVNNLLENAMKYSPKEKSIVCRLYSAKNKLVLEIIDEGLGIPDGEKKKVFDKFYRIGNEATRTTKGTGLGLYLFKKISGDFLARLCRRYVIQLSF